MLSFKQYQRDTLLRMLRLQPQSQPSLSSLSSHQQSFNQYFNANATQWKVLVYDKYSRDIIAPQLTLQQLKQEGITLHLLLNQPREIVKQVPVVYFIRPTEANVTMLINDFDRQLYDTVYINFTTIPPGFLEHFAQRLANECAQSDNFNNCIKEVNNLMIDYICAEDNCISLHHSYSYLCLYSSLLGSQQIMKYIEKIAASLLSLIFQVYTHHNSLPYFYIPQSSNTPSHMVIKYICQHLPTLLSNHHSQQSGGVQSATSLYTMLSQIHYSKRWKLVLLDRNITLGSQFLQNIQYLSLVYDLGFKHGHVTLPQPDTPQPTPQIQHQKTKQLAYQNIDIDSNDSLWTANRYKILPDVAETIHHTNVQYKNEIARINGLMQSGMNAQAGGPHQLQGLGTTDYNSIITTLPILTRKKTQLDAHTSICTTLVQTTGQRQLHKTFPVELSLLSSHFKTLFKPGVGITGGTGVEGVAINAQTQQPVCFDDVIKMLQTADQFANQNLTTPMTPQQVQQSQNQYTGSLSPLDRLRLICLLIVTGLNTSTTNSTFVNLVTNLKRTCSDSRYFPHFHTNANQIDQLVNFCISTTTSVAMQFKSQAVPRTSQQTNQQGGAATKAMSFLAGSASLFVSQENRTPVHQFVLDPAPFTAVHGAPGAGNMDKSLPLMLIDPIMQMQMQLQSNPANPQFPQTIPPASQLLGLETMVFIVGSGNYTEYINLCGEYSNFTYSSDSQSPGSNATLPGSSIGIGGVAGSGIGGVSGGVIGYDDDKQLKEAYSDKIKKGQIPKGVVYGCTEMVSNGDFFAMIGIIALLNHIVSANQTLSQQLTTKLQGIIAMVQNGIIPSSMGSNHSAQPTPAQQLSNLQNQFLQQLSTISVNSQQPQEQDPNAQITHQIAQNILAALELSQQ